MQREASIDCRTGRKSDNWPPPSLSRVTPSAASEHFSELLGCPISRSLTASCVGLELRPLPSPGITRLQRYYEPLRHPSAPGLSLAGVRLICSCRARGTPERPSRHQSSWPSRVARGSNCPPAVWCPATPRDGRSAHGSSLTTHRGLPCCARFPCGHAAATTPVQRLGLRFAHSPQPYQPSPEGAPGRPAHRRFRGCSAFTRVAACPLALSPIRDTLIEGFSHFVTSMTAPIASGGSEFAGRDLHPLESAALPRRTPKGVIERAPGGTA